MERQARSRSDKAMDGVLDQLEPPTRPPRSDEPANDKTLFRLFLQPRLINDRFDIVTLARPERSREQIFHVT